MHDALKDTELSRTSQMVILVSYTAFSLILIGESLLLGWEKWALVLMSLALIGAWIIHIRQKVDPNVRLWIYSFMMMAVFFFYGIHRTSLFDLAGVMLVVIMIYTMTGKRALVLLCQFTYFVTFGYGLIQYWISGELIDALVITRSMLHIVLIIMGGQIGRIIIETWNKVLEKSSSEIRELKEATERLDNFLANVSHEIRTPVNAVIGLSSVLKKETLPAAATDSITAISRAGHRVAEQIGDILDFTEIDMDKLSVNNETYLMGSLVNDVLVQLGNVDTYDLDFVMDLESGVPAELTGDASKIKKILWHLISNGFKFTKEGGVYVHLYPIRREYGINLVIEVRDTGVGIDDDEIEHIYEQFYQSDASRARTVGGLGLGIPIVNGFVKALGGVMAIESDQGEGTTVRVSIPQSVVEDTPCISIQNKEGCVVAGFLGFMTTGHPKIREFYMEMIGHLVEGLNVPFHRVQSRQDLEELIRTTRISHLFVGTGEYLENKEYIDSLVTTINVAMVKDRDYSGSVGAGISLLPKPFYGVQIANFLNQDLKDHTADLGEEKILFTGVRSLVVDDEPMNLLVARGIFEGYGMQVDTVLSGMEAIEACEETDYDIVFMDHMMPEMDGVEAMKRIRINISRSKKEICIVALTANAISSAKEMFLSEGFDGFIPKPIEITEFERVMKRVLPKALITVVPKEVQSLVAEPVQKEKPRQGRSKYDPVKEQGTDVEAGLRYCKNDEEFYDQLLAEYAKNDTKKTDELNRYLDNENWQDYSIRVHAVKSTSKMIGAMELSEMAKRLEDASKKADADRVRAEHPAFIKRYAALLSAISTVVGGASESTLVQTQEKEDESEILEFAPEGESE
ncbi:MAG: response regulator [Lachnospiraceae bacterium]|nr:response regulator [Lachnospiraceae bacterium]